MKKNLKFKNLFILKIKFGAIYHYLLNMIKQTSVNQPRKRNQRIVSEFYSKEKYRKKIIITEKTKFEKWSPNQELQSICLINKKYYDIPTFQDRIRQRRKISQIYAQRKFRKLKLKLFYDVNIQKNQPNLIKHKRNFGKKLKLALKTFKKQLIQQNIRNIYDIIRIQLFTKKQEFMKKQMSFCLIKMRNNSLRVRELLDQSFIMKLGNMILSTNTHDNYINDQEKPFSEDLSEKKTLNKKKKKNKIRKLINIIQKQTFLVSQVMVKNDQLFYYLAMQKLLNPIQLCLLRLLELISSMQHNCYHAQLIIYLIKLMGCSIQKKQFAKYGQKTKSEVEIQNDEILKQNTKSPKSVSIKASPSPQKKKLDRSKQIRIENLLFNKNRRSGQIQSKEQYQYEQTIIRLITN